MPTRLPRSSARQGFRRPWRSDIGSIAASTCGRGRQRGSCTCTPFDPLVFQRLGVIGITPDAASARKWYQRAAEVPRKAGLGALGRLFGSGLLVRAAVGQAGALRQAGVIGRVLRDRRARHCRKDVDLATMKPSVGDSKREHRPHNSRNFFCAGHQETLSGLLREKFVRARPARRGVALKSFDLIAVALARAQARLGPLHFALKMLKCARPGHGYSKIG
jgi:hypothetical protein